MALTNGSTGAITSAAGNMLGHVLSIADDAAFTWSQTTDIADVTNFTNTDTSGKDFLPTLRSSSFTWEAHYSDAAILSGRLALISAASGTTPYTTAINAATLTLTTTFEDSTVFASGGVTDRAFTPTDFYWDLSYSGFFDAGSAFPQTESPAVGTLNAWTVTIETGATDSTITGNGIVTAYNVGEVRKGVLTPFSGSVRLTGDITSEQTPTGSNPLLPDATMVLPTAGTTVLTAATSRTFTVSSFTSSLSFNLSVGAPITITGTDQCSGGVTVA